MDTVNPKRRSGSTFIQQSKNGEGEGVSAKHAVSGPFLPGAQLIPGSSTASPALLLWRHSQHFF